MRSSTTAILVLSVFTVSVGYGAVLPQLPDAVAGLLGGSASTGAVSRHTGLLTAAYALALLLAAPAWGRLSDTRGRRDVLVASLMGFSVAMAGLSVVATVAAIYAQRFLSGLFAAAALPVASAAIGDLSPADERRGRGLALISMGSVAGFVAGPSVGVLLTQAGARLGGGSSSVGAITTPLASTAVLSALAGIAVALAVPNWPGRHAAASVRTRKMTRPPPVVSVLLGVTFAVSVAVGVFEVGLALRGTQELNLAPPQVAAMFTECSLVMLAAQAMVFGPWTRADATRWLIVPALVALGIGLALVPLAPAFRSILLVTGGVAASAGILTPILAYWISATAAHALGGEMGRQAAAASLGITVGSAAGGLLFDVPVVRGAPFVMAAGLVASVAWLSRGLPRALAPARTGYDSRTQGPE